MPAYLANLKPLVNIKYGFVLGGSGLRNGWKPKQQFSQLTACLEVGLMAFISDGRWELSFLNSLRNDWR